jgi:hypothetical protein
LFGGRRRTTRGVRYGQGPALADREDGRARPATAFASCIRSRGRARGSIRSHHQL